MGRSGCKSWYKTSFSLFGCTPGSNFRLKELPTKTSRQFPVLRNFTTSRILILEIRLFLSYKRHLKKEKSLRRVKISTRSKTRSMRCKARSRALIASSIRLFGRCSPNRQPNETDAQYLKLNFRPDLLLSNHMDLNKPIEYYADCNYHKIFQYV